MRSRIKYRYVIGYQYLLVRKFQTKNKNKKKDNFFKIQQQQHILLWINSRMNREKRKQVVFKNVK